jgi:hypothetical protein
MMVRAGHCVIVMIDASSASWFESALVRTTQINAWCYVTRYTQVINSLIQTSLQLGIANEVSLGIQTSAPKKWSCNVHGEACFGVEF